MKRKVQNGKLGNDNGQDKTIRRETVGGGTLGRDSPRGTLCFSLGNSGPRSYRVVPEFVRNSVTPGAVLSGHLIIIQILTRGPSPSESSVT